jgi:predicted nuclease of predicted toxin-antitoxin system
MRILIDECLPKRLKLELPDHFVQTVPEAGWAGKQNGELLRLAENEFDVLLTNDQNMEHQQNLKQFDLAFIVLVAPTNDIDDLRPLMLAVNEALTSITAGDLKYIR